jgi:hypothetical protein
MPILRSFAKCSCSEVWQLDEESRQGGQRFLNSRLSLWPMDLHFEPMVPAIGRPPDLGRNGDRRHEHITSDVPVGLVYPRKLFHPPTVHRSLAIVLNPATAQIAATGCSLDWLGQPRLGVCRHPTPGNDVATLSACDPLWFATLSPIHGARGVAVVRSRFGRRVPQSQQGGAHAKNYEDRAGDNKSDDDPWPAASRMRPDTQDVAPRRVSGPNTDLGPPPYRLNVRVAHERTDRRHFVMLTARAVCGSGWPQCTLCGRSVRRD